jgi:divalent metal cation (Fe/Co/Zn/Cd) transporter
VTLGVLALRGRQRRTALADPVAAAIIAAVIASMAVRILVGSFHTLTDCAVFASMRWRRSCCRSGTRSCGEIRTRGGPGVVRATWWCT